MSVTRRGILRDTHCGTSILLSRLCHWDSVIVFLKESFSPSPLTFTSYQRGYGVSLIKEHCVFVGEYKMNR